jgi:hypothetical protein
MADGGHGEAPVTAEAKAGTMPSAVEPEDLQGEQVYVLYRPAATGRGEGEAVDVRESVESPARL